MSGIKPIFQWQHANRTVLPYSWWQDCTEADFKVRDNKTQFNVRIVFETTAVIESLRAANESQAKRIAELEAAVKANHEWHQEHDDYDGYQESALYTKNTSTLSASKNGAENDK